MWTDNMDCYFLLQSIRFMTIQDTCSWFGSILVMWIPCHHRQFVMFGKHSRLCQSFTRHNFIYWGLRKYLSLKVGTFVQACCAYMGSPVCHANGHIFTQSCNWLISRRGCAPLLKRPCNLWSSVGTGYKKLLFIHWACLYESRYTVLEAKITIHIFATCNHRCNRRQIFCAERGQIRGLSILTGF